MIGYERVYSNDYPYGFDSDFWGFDFPTQKPCRGMFGICLEFARNQGKKNTKITKYNLEKKPKKKFIPVKKVMPKLLYTNGFRI